MIDLNKLVKLLIKLSEREYDRYFLSSGESAAEALLKSKIYDDLIEVFEELK